MAKAAFYTGLDRRLAKPSPRMVALAVLGVSGILFVTLCPIGLRPRLATPDAERFFAYFALGGVIALAAGRRGLMGLALVVGLALGLEAAQLLVPGRDAATPDALVKALGGVCGSAGAQVAFALKRLVLRLRGRWVRREAIASATAG